MKSTTVTISFDATPYTLKDWVIISLPKEESLKFSSRGQISTKVTIHDHEFDMILEPDGRWSHWMRITEDLQKHARITVGQKIPVQIVTKSTWPEPVVPEDLKAALKSAPQAVTAKWRDITPMARWEWVRWMNSTGSEETLEIRIQKTISKLSGKHRRPCCFNLAACTEPYVSKGGRLLEA